MCKLLLQKKIILAENNTNSFKFNVGKKLLDIKNNPSVKSLS